MQSTQLQRRTMLFVVSVALAVLAAFATAPGLAGAREFTGGLWRELQSGASHALQTRQP
jgi:hypothetical protein